MRVPSCVLLVNDPFVMREWAKRYAPQNTNPATKEQIVHLISDSSGLYTKALGMEHDLTRKQMGPRSRRFGMLADNLIVKVVKVELVEGVNDVSKAEHMLTATEALNPERHTLAAIENPPPECQMSLEDLELIEAGIEGLHDEENDDISLSE